MAITTAQKTHLEKIERAQMVIKNAENIFKTYNTRYDMWTEQGGEIVAVEIYWGDWKHDHAFVDWVFKEMNYNILRDNEIFLTKHSEDVTEEDGSDTYSSIHKFIILN